MTREAWTTIRLTLKIHRFEVLLAILAVALVSAAMAWFLVRLDGASIPPGCTPQSEDGACLDVIRSFRAAVRESSILRDDFPALFVVGLGVLLGTPLVARELELRTTLMAWSLSARRAVWFGQRVLPPLALLLVGSALVIILGDILAEAVVRDEPEQRIEDFGQSGLLLAAQGFAAFGVALFIGALVGRTLPTFILAGLLLAGTVWLAAPMAQEKALEQMTQTWTEPYSAAEGEFVEAAETFRVFGTMFFLGDENYLELRDVPVPLDVDVEAWREANVMRQREVVSLGDFRAVELGSAGLAGLAGLLAIGASYLVVSRRRPM